MSITKIRQLCRPKIPKRKLLERSERKVQKPLLGYAHLSPK
ncbi:MAG: hypothetical protein U5L45_07835 [Saprospiraceae bacterium]|nr:hypothetical protein [Saprospiraceae bacterium]